jgi:hypothetical protein
MPEARVGSILRSPGDAPAVSEDVLSNLRRVGKPVAWAVLPARTLKLLAETTGGAAEFAVVSDALKEGESLFVTLQLEEAHVRVQAGLVVDSPTAARRLADLLRDSWRALSTDVKLRIVPLLPQEYQALAREMVDSVTVYSNDRVVQLSARCSFKSLAKLDQK